MKQIGYGKHVILMYFKHNKEYCFFDDYLLEYKNGKYNEIIFTNLNGPAIINSDGGLEYWINGLFVGENLSNEEFAQIVKKYIFK